jgi:hypothetical protein
MDVDLKLATRVRGIDAILTAVTRDGVPQPTLVANAGAGPRDQRWQQRQNSRGARSRRERRSGRRYRRLVPVYSALLRGPA